MRNEKEILTALLYCQHIASNCIDCPYNDQWSKDHVCEIILHNDAHDLIKKLMDMRVGHRNGERK